VFARMAPGHARMLSPKVIRYLINGLDLVRLERTATARRTLKMSTIIFKNQCSDFQK
jgi:hypothetical protein